MMAAAIAGVPRGALILITIALIGCGREAAKLSTPTVYARNQCGGQPRWAGFGRKEGDLATHNLLRITRSEMLWNGSAIDRATLDDYLGQVRALKPQPITALVPDATAKCDDVLAVRRMMESRLSCSAKDYCTEDTAQNWATRHPPIP